VIAELGERPWERLPAESAKAFAAFCAYRDLGPERSLNAAYGEGRAPGHWSQWSSEYRWVERATAYDAYLDAERRKVREAKLRALEERRFDLELRDQDRVERRLDKIEAKLDQADLAPVVEVVTMRPDGSVTKVKGVNLSQYARLVDIANKTATQAILGVRPKATEVDDAATSAVKGEFVWVPPTEEP
jgi:hypothetical protein